MWNYALATMKKGINAQIAKHKHDKLKAIKEGYKLTWNEFIGDFSLEILYALTFREFNEVIYENCWEAVDLVYAKYREQAKERYRKLGLLTPQEELELRS